MLTYFVIVPILIGVFLYLFSFVTAGRIIAVLAQIGMVVAAWYLFFASQEAYVITNIGNFDSVLGIFLKADYLTSVFILLTTFVFLIATIYSFNEYNSRLFWFILYVWQSSIIGIFLTMDLFNLFVLMEVSTIVVAVMIMYKRNNRSMYDGMVYLMVNIVAVQFYLFGVGYIYMLTGAMDMQLVTARLALLDKSQLVLPYALIMTSVVFKCALVPLYSWLPKAHGTPGAPSAVSAILSGLHIKSGLYIFLRFQEMFAGINMSEFFIALGIITSIVGIVLAISQSDIKLILAYSTVAQIGLIMIGLNIGNIYSFTGALYHVINHALFKAALFLSAGIIIHTFHTRDIYKMRGVFRRIPTVGTATILAVLGITGAPFFNGSISKYFMATGAYGLLDWTIILINIGTIIVFIRYSAILWGRPTPNTEAPKLETCKQIAIFTLCALCFIGGIFGVQFIQFLFNMDVYLSRDGYIEKMAIFAASWALGFLIYIGILKNNHLRRLRDFDLGFRGICVCMGIFFGVILVVVNVV